MTEESREETEEAGEETVLQERIEAYRGRYARLFRRRWGKEPPAIHTARVALIANGSGGEEEGIWLSSLLTSRGALTEEWWLDSGENPVSAGEENDAVLVAATNIPNDQVGEIFRRMMRRAVSRSAVIAAVDGGIALLAREGFLRGRAAAFASHERAAMERWGVRWSGSSVTQDGMFLTAEGRRNTQVLVRTLLEMLSQSPAEELDK